MAGLLQRGGVLGLSAEGDVVVRLTNKEQDVEQNSGGALEVAQRRSF